MLVVVEPVGRGSSSLRRGGSGLHWGRGSGLRVVGIGLCRSGFSLRCGKTWKEKRAGEQNCDEGCLDACHKEQGEASAGSCFYFILQGLSAALHLQEGIWLTVGAGLVGAGVNIVDARLGLVNREHSASAGIGDPRVFVVGGG